MKKYSKIVMFLSGLLVLVALFALVSPISLFAQSSIVRYKRNPSNGALYLLPNRGFPLAYDNGQSVASGLSASCSPSLLNANINQTVTWLSSVTGGSGSYLYTWNGTDGLSGNTSALSANYSSNGEKFATVTVTSGNRMITVSCGSTRIGPYNYQYTSQFAQTGLGASCYATPERALPGENITWLAIVSGTTASTTYAWDGTDGLTGDRPLISKTYATNGTKAALLIVTNGGARVVASCTNAVLVGPKTTFVYKSPATTTTATPVAPSDTAQDLELKGICTSSVARAEVGEEVEWKSAIIGGTGAYRLSWSGDDNLSGSATTTAQIYETVGLKNAKVRIASGDTSNTLACTPVEIIKKESGLLASVVNAIPFGAIAFVLATILAILIGVLFARRKKKQEEKENEESDHVQ